MSRRGSTKWNGSSKDAQAFRDRVVVGDISLLSSAREVKELNEDILGKYSIKQVENAMLRMGESELGKALKVRNTQGTVDCLLLLSLHRLCVLFAFLRIFGRFLNILV